MSERDPLLGQTLSLSDAYARSAAAHSADLVEYMQNAIETGDVKETALVRRYSGRVRSRHVCVCCCAVCCCGACGEGFGLRVGAIYFDKKNPQRVASAVFWWPQRAYQTTTQHRIIVLIDGILDAEKTATHDPVFTFDHIASIIKATQPLWGAPSFGNGPYSAGTMLQASYVAEGYHMKWSLSMGSIAKFVELLSSNESMQQLQMRRGAEIQQNLMTLMAGGGTASAMAMASVAAAVTQPPAQPPISAPAGGVYGGLSHIRTCSKCSATTAASDQKFCGSCGAPLESPA